MARLIWVLVSYRAASSHFSGTRAQELLGGAITLRNHFKTVIDHTFGNAPALEALDACRGESHQVVQQCSTDVGT